MTDANEIGLSERERHVLCWGLRGWGGPAYATDEVAHVIGFDSVDELYREAARISDALRAGQPLSRAEWRAAIIATEIAFISWPLGAADDWQTVTGLTDEETLPLIRSAQHKLRDVVR